MTQGTHLHPEQTRRINKKTTRYLSNYACFLLLARTCMTSYTLWTPKLGYFSLPLLIAVKVLMSVTMKDLSRVSIQCFSSFSRLPFHNSKLTPVNVFLYILRDLSRNSFSCVRSRSLSSKPPSKLCASSIPLLNSLSSCVHPLSPFDTLPPPFSSRAFCVSHSFQPPCYLSALRSDGSTHAYRQPTRHS